MNSSSLFKLKIFKCQYNVLLRYSCLKNSSYCCPAISTIHTVFKRYCQNSPGLLSLSKRKNIYHSKKNNYSTMEVNVLQNFILNDYDCIGFDLDNTLCEYKIKPMVQMEYDILSRYLVEQKGYDSEYLLSPLTKEDIDFLQRGLILDFEKGNVLKLGENGLIIKASHGTKALSEGDVKLLYGESMKFDYAEPLCKDLTCAWEDQLRSKFRLLLDFFDLPASLGFARAVDSLDKHGDNNFFSVGKDVLSALAYMYSRDHFSTNKSEYFKKLKLNPDEYINKCSNDVVSWLKEVGKTKILFLVTGSNIDYASFTAAYCLGEDWLDIFDLVVCFARKPGFFYLKRPFLEVSGMKECDEVKNTSLKLNKIYSQGNWNDLQNFLREATPSDKPKCLYVGDNVVEDIYTPHLHSLCDTLAISEELAAEKIWKPVEEHPSSEYLTSKRWGSFFKDELTNKPTLWGRVIYKCSKFCLPSVSALPSLPFKDNVASNANSCDGITTKITH